MIHKFRLLCLTSVFLTVFFQMNSLYGDVGDWKTFTSTREVNDIVVGDTSIWCATNGGVLQFSVKDTVFNIFTNTEGLAINEAIAIEKDHMGRIWVGLGDGRLAVCLRSAGLFVLSAVRAPVKCRHDSGAPERSRYPCRGRQGVRKNHRYRAQ